MDGPSLHQHIRTLDTSSAHHVSSLSSKTPHISQNLVTPATPEVLEAPLSSQQTFEQVPSYGTTQFRRVTVTTLLLLANLVQMIVNFAGVAGGSKLSSAMGVKDSYSSWMAASYALANRYSLTQGAFVMISGRVGDVYGHKQLLLIGGAWLSLCTLIGAFCNNFFAFITMRALAGVGGAIIMPNAVAMISATNPPGRMRNLSLGLFGASAPMGGYCGALFLGAFLVHTSYKWFFLFISLLGVVTFLPLWALAPSEPPVDKNGTIDWTGSALGTISLMLFSFVWNQAPSVGWSTPYEIVLLIISVIMFAAFIYWEKHIASEPIMPLDAFKAPSFQILLLVILLNFMAVGTLIWYQVLWLQDIWHWSTLHFAAGWSPFVVCATAAASLAAWLIPRMAAQWILALGTIAILLSNLLMATLPVNQTYWAQVFPSVVLFSFCPDFVYTAGQIIASNSVQRRQQGVAGSIIGTLNLYGNSLGLGFASTVEVQVARHYQSRIMGIRGALFFGVAVSAIALVLDICFVRMVKDEREGWHEEDQASLNQIELRDQAEATGSEIPIVSSRA
ncbi:major facilitator superfamily domain-containing protein [Penicillium herquei]|nr:major facilitator superfamily domain-containing protein [Penicillium herquei]